MMSHSLGNRGLISEPKTAFFVDDNEQLDRSADAENIGAHGTLDWRLLFPAGDSARL